jgi:type IV secretion system protein VirB9
MKIKTLSFTLGFVFGANAFAQSGPSGTRSLAAPQLPELLKEYNYAAQIEALNNLTTLDPGTENPSTTPEFAAVPTQTGNTPSQQTDVALSPTALAAVRVSEKWRGNANEPAAGADGRVLYSFGAGLPTVVCAPLRVCIIELQAGEHIVGAPQIGDSVRWNISPAMYGAGSDATSVIVLKPTAVGLDTNLLIATDRRAYYLRLISRAQEYVARVAFQYAQDDNAQKWRQHDLDQQLALKLPKHEEETLPSVLEADRLNFSYQVSGSNEHLRPVRVFDDGAKTYIQMPSDMQHREVPILLVLGMDGKGEMTNYRVRRQTFIVDRLFDRAQLVLGTGKKAQRVEISRGSKG